MNVNMDKLAMIECCKKSPLSNSRLSRFMHTPKKNIIITILRNIGTTKVVDCKTIFRLNFHGIIPEAVTSLIWRFGLYEPETSLYLIENVTADDVFLDIGAHFGYFSLLASTLVGGEGKVIAIEAMPKTYEILTQNISLNKLENVSTHQFAAGNEAGSVEFRDYGIVNSSLNTFIKVRGSLENKQVEHKLVNVEVKSIDTFFKEQNLPMPTFVKIDAESSEHLVIQGMDEILKGNNSPTLLIEMGGGDVGEDERARNIVQTLEKYGYKLYIYKDSKLKLYALEGNIPYFNGIFLPPHKQML